ncbi:MAG: sigma 54-interacting transcriptional regulator [Bilophila wadsworthia]
MEGHQRRPKKKQDNTIRQENELRERLKARCSGDIAESPQITPSDLIASGAVTTTCHTANQGRCAGGPAIHDGSSRYQQPFVAVNCGAIPESLFESELFGYKKGAFTGATADKKGYLDQADGGTLFLDELGEISLMGQVKLLRAIEHGGFTPVGGAQIHRPDVRIIAATNRDLLERVNEGAMRRDFYYRIHVIPIHLPPLRERKADIPLLVEHFLKAYPSNKRFEYMDSEMLHAFILDWPGNVRELQNVLYQYLSLGTARLGDTVIGETTAQAAASEAPEDSLTLAEALSRFEKVYLLNALKKNNWKRGPTADSLGMDRRTLFRKMKDFGLEKE